MSDEVVRLRGVGVRRGGSMLLRDIDWTVHDNERWVVIGPNGAGKTTLLQVAACQLFPSEGRAEILGERLGETDVFELRPRIGLASSAVADGVLPTFTPAASSASFFAAAVPDDPDTIAPAWPIVLPSGAVKPAT